MEEPRRINNQVKIPEKEATDLNRILRSRNELRAYPLSVTDYVNRSGVRALHIAVDNPTGVNGEYDRMDLRYKADLEMTQIVRNAVKKITARFSK